MGRASREPYHSINLVPFWSSSVYFFISYSRVHSLSLDSFQEVSVLCCELLRVKLVTKGVTVSFPSRRRIKASWELIFMALQQPENTLTHWVHTLLHQPILSGHPQRLPLCMRGKPGNEPCGRFEQPLSWRSMKTSKSSAGGHGSN